ncbi:MAG: hypothetical protein AAF485_04710 [Chloroflexota bacterium]
MMHNSATDSLATAWQTNLEGTICEACEWHYLVPEGQLPTRCPHCFQADLVPLEEYDESLPYHRPPELILPFEVSMKQVERNVETFANNIWFAPGDLTLQNLQGRLQRIYLPMWLVDSDVQAHWQAEAGFNYEAVSHRDRFNDNRGGWESQKVTETRIQWEPRLGRLTRTYHNTIAPALEEHYQLQRDLGQYNIKEAKRYAAETITDSFIRVPNRLPEDAWSDAIPGIQAAAHQECQQASQADHLREFRWSAEYGNLNWTLLLLPMYVTYYLDDEQQPQQILIHGQSGKIEGQQRASMKRAQQTALYIAIAAIIIFGITLVLGALSFAVPPLFLLAAIGLVIALIVGLAALIPLVIVWRFNKTP